MSQINQSVEEKIKFVLETIDENKKELDRWASIEIDAKIQAEIMREKMLFEYEKLRVILEKRSLLSL